MDSVVVYKTDCIFTHLIYSCERSQWRLFVAKFVSRAEKVQFYMQGLLIGKKRVFIVFFLLLTRNQTENLQLLIRR